MSSAPQTLKDLRVYLAAEYAVEPKNFGIRGTVSARRAWGYHLGEADIYGQYGMGDKDYSVMRRRDKRGLSNASAGFDIRLPQGKLRALREYLVTIAKSGADGAMLREIIGPDESGAAKRYARENAWRPEAARADHEWHIHVSFFRDTESDDKRPLFYGLLGMPVEPPPDITDPPIEPPAEPAPPPEPTQAEMDLADARDTLQEIAAAAAQALS